MKQKKIKTIALIAHDNKKADIVNWALKNKETLKNYELCAILILMLPESSGSRRSNLPQRLVPPSSAS